VPGGIPATPLGPLWLLRTDLPPDVLRRNVRLVGQLLHGRGDWRWLAAQDGDGRKEVGRTDTERGEAGKPGRQAEQAKERKETRAGEQTKEAEVEKKGEEEGEEEEAGVPSSGEEAMD